MIYVGIDVHQKTSAICELDNDGTKLIELELPTTREALIRWFSRDEELRVCLETCGVS